MTGFPVKKHRFPVGKTGFPIFEFEVSSRPVSSGFHREPAGFPFPDSSGKTLPDGNVNPASTQGLQSRSETAGNRVFFPFPELGGIGNRQDFPENFAQI